VAGNMNESFGEATGVQPFLVANDSLGHDRFVFRQNLAALNLPDGTHKFVVKIKDVNGHETAEADALDTSVEFLIGNPRPFVSDVEISKNPEIFYTAFWESDATGLNLNRYTHEPLEPGATYTIELSFSEPMWTRIG